MAAIALSLTIARKDFYDALQPDARKNLVAWLSVIQQRILPRNNWYFFRVMVCMAFRSLGLPVDKAAENEAFDLVESFYVGEGWYRDGNNKSFDYYNPWAMHFYGLVYAKFIDDCPDASAEEKARAGRYKERACEFARHYKHWFAADGANVAFGRSLTYRFAADSFWGACAYAGVEALPWAEMKGIFLRNLRWWFARPIFDNAGVLSVGYGYPNLAMADFYNAPGSPYWALKAYLPLALPDTHPFWAAEEAPAPSAAAPADAPIVDIDGAACYITSGSKEDTLLYAAAEQPAFNMGHRAEKYCKFAYSARFGFCVSLSPFDIEKAGCDSMLFFRRVTNDAAAAPEAWYGRVGILERRLERGPDNRAHIVSVWAPMAGVRVETTIIPRGAAHLRIHKIRTEYALETVEGGFAISRFGGFDESRLHLPAAAENSAASRHEALAGYNWGASRIAALENGTLMRKPRTGALVQPAPNLNLLYPQVVIPVLRGEIGAGESVYITVVTAGDRERVVKGDAHHIIDLEAL